MSSPGSTHSQENAAHQLVAIQQAAQEELAALPLMWLGYSKGEEGTGQLEALTDEDGASEGSDEAPSDVSGPKYEYHIDDDGPHKDDESRWTPAHPRRNPSNPGAREGIMPDSTTPTIMAFYHTYFLSIEAYQEGKPIRFNAKNQDPQRPIPYHLVPPLLKTFPDGTVLFICRYANEGSLHTQSCRQVEHKTFVDFRDHLKYTISCGWPILNPATGAETGERCWKHFKFKTDGSRPFFSLLDHRLKSEHHGNLKKRGKTQEELNTAIALRKGRGREDDRSGASAAKAARTSTISGRGA
ncbi:hypothetical protein BJ508DRAFT_128524 [Ascobolus immersus RN42]|uniref:Uncharacterized protein n=1 Tax=Ascobolus immersus RN42 TaxID=1160509 RepID=A0A3N4IFW9_ASCIM|nr:hypothetical protein BJ508DRAFT_128524 [Ascobolus immersus RN42]